MKNLGKFYFLGVKSDWKKTGNLEDCWGIIDARKSKKYDWVEWTEMKFEGMEAKIIDIWMDKK